MKQTGPFSIKCSFCKTIRSISYHHEIDRIAALDLFRELKENVGDFPCFKESDICIVNILDKGHTSDINGNDFEYIVTTDGNVANYDPKLNCFISRRRVSNLSWVTDYLFLMRDSKKKDEYLRITVNCEWKPK